MFKLKADPTFRRAVKIRALDGQVHELHLDMRHMRKADLEAFVAALPGRPDEDVVRDLVVGWHDVDTEFTPDALAELLQQYEGAGVEIWREYLRAYEDARAKN